MQPRMANGCNRSPVRLGGGQDWVARLLGATILCLRKSLSRNDFIRCIALARFTHTQPPSHPRLAVGRGPSRRGQPGRGWPSCRTRIGNGRRIANPGVLPFPRKRTTGYTQLKQSQHSATSKLARRAGRRNLYRIVGISPCRFSPPRADSRPLTPSSGRLPRNPIGGPSP